VAVVVRVSVAVPVGVWVGVPVSAGVAVAVCVAAAVPVSVAVAVGVPVSEAVAVGVSLGVGVIHSLGSALAKPGSVPSKGKLWIAPVATSAPTSATVPTTTCPSIAALRKSSVPAGSSRLPRTSMPEIPLGPVLRTPRFTTSGKLNRT
jgi:hypothetical protein